jgi:hypothetical protein
VEPKPDDLRDALFTAAITACSAERSHAWTARFDPDKAEESDRTRQRALRAVENLLVHTARTNVLTSDAARRLGVAVYEAMATERRAIVGPHFSDDVDGHYQRLNRMSRAIDHAWSLGRFSASIRALTSLRWLRA